MKKIPLTKGKFAIVDDRDYNLLIAMGRWHIATGNYAQRYSRRDHNGKRARVYMHRVILQVASDMEVDHINGDGLDNRRRNLRRCTRHENRHNTRRYRNNTSGFKGVTRQQGKWIAHIGIGSFTTPEEAARAYDRVAVMIYGRFARTNQAMGLLDRR